jgi:hypothetical protein
MAIVIVTMVKTRRKAISPEIVERLALLKRIDFKASTAYASGFTFANALSHSGKLAIGYIAPLGKKRITFRNPLRTPTILGWFALPRITNIILSRQSVVNMITISIEKPCSITLGKGIPVMSKLTTNINVAMIVVIESPLRTRPDTICDLESGVNR